MNQRTAAIACATNSFERGDHRPVRREAVEMCEKRLPWLRIEQRQQHLPKYSLVTLADQRCPQKGIVVKPVLHMRNGPTAILCIGRNRHQADEAVIVPQREYLHPTCWIEPGQRGRQEPAFIERVGFGCMSRQIIPGRNKRVVEHRPPASQPRNKRIRSVPQFDRPGRHAAPFRIGLAVA